MHQEGLLGMTGMIIFFDISAFDIMMGLKGLIDVP